MKLVLILMKKIFQDATNANLFFVLILFGLVNKFGLMFYKKLKKKLNYVICFFLYFRSFHLFRYFLSNKNNNSMLEHHLLFIQQLVMQQFLMRIIFPLLKLISKQHLQLRLQRRFSSTFFLLLLLFSHRFHGPAAQILPQLFSTNLH